MNEKTRTYFRPFVLLAAACCAAVSVYIAPGAAASPASSNLSSLILSSSDITRVYGSGFHLLLSRETKNSQLRGTAASLSQGALTGLQGRVTGYISMYTHSRLTVRGKKSVASPGVSIVLSGVNQYQNADYAHRSLTASMNAKGKISKGMTESLSPLPGLGNLAVIETVHEVLSGDPITDSVYIGFQEGKYSALVDVAAYGGKPSASTVLGLCKVLDARIRARG